MLRAFGRDLWLTEGPVVVAAAGFHYPTRMAVIRLDRGGLALWSPVALSPALKAEVEAIGPVTHLIAPNSLHHLALPDWLAACPGARAHAAPGLRAKRPDIAFDSELGPDPHPGWVGDMDQVVFAGNRITTEVVFFHKASGTALFTDLLQQLPADWFSGWRRLVARLDLMTTPAPAVPRKFRAAQTDRAAGRQALGRIMDWPVERLVMAHGTPLDTGGKAAVVRAFGWLG